MEDDSRFIEYYNLVFMELNRSVRPSGNGLVSSVHRAPRIGGMFCLAGQQTEH